MKNFKPSSWEKIREATSQVKGKKVALIKDGEILMIPLMYEPVDRSAQVTGVTNTTPDNFLNGLVLYPRPSYLNSDELHDQFLAKWISKHPNDILLKEQIASQYFNQRFLK